MRNRNFNYIENYERLNLTDSEWESLAMQPSSLNDWRTDDELEQDIKQAEESIKKEKNIINGYIIDSW